MTASTPLTRPASLDEFFERQEQTKNNRWEESTELGLKYQPHPSDVFITPFGKSGTTWLQQIVHGLRTRGDMDFDDISRVVPWLEPAHALGLDVNAPQRGSFKAFKSHLNWHDIPKDGRYIVSVRDPKDVLVSMFYFLDGWQFERGSVEIADFAHRVFLKNREERGYWHHLRSWWPHRHDDKVLMMCYEDMRLDLPKTVHTVAHFLGIELDDELLEIVIRQSSLDFMLAHKDKFDDLLIRQLNDKQRGLPPDGDAAKVRNGQVGSHRQELPPKIGAEMDAIWQEEITPDLGLASYQELRQTLAREKAEREGPAA